MRLALPRGLSPRQTQLVCLLAARPSLARRDYQRLLDVSHNTARRDLNELVEAGLIVPIGCSAGRRYALSERAVTGSSLAGGAPQSRATVLIEVEPLSLSGLGS